MRLLLIVCYFVNSSVSLCFFRLYLFQLDMSNITHHRSRYLWQEWMARSTAKDRIVCDEYEAKRTTTASAATRTTAKRMRPKKKGSHNLKLVYLLWKWHWTSLFGTIISHILCVHTRVHLSLWIQSMFIFLSAFFSSPHSVRCCYLFLGFGMCVINKRTTMCVCACYVAVHWDFLKYTDSSPQRLFDCDGGHINH